MNKKEKQKSLLDTFDFMISTKIKFYFIVGV